MKFTTHSIIFLSIFFGFCLDSLIATFQIKTYLSLLGNTPYLMQTCFGFLVFCYWVYAIPERLRIFSALLYGLLIDLSFGDAVGFHMLFFGISSYVIHVYAFRFRLFSYIQLIIFFASASTFYLACEYLLFSPNNYSYFLLLSSFFINAIIWLPIYFCMRFVRRKLL